MQVNRFETESSLEKLMLRTGTGNLMEIDDYDYYYIFNVLT